MRDPLHVAAVTLTDASPEQIRRGLVGFLVIELAGGLVIEGATLRRSRAGVRSVSFPRNRKGYPYIWLRTPTARRDLERQVFERLGVGMSEFRSTAHSKERRP
jgi:hypothetical protein